MEHKVRFFDNYGWADYCDCGEQSVMCQNCGEARCLTQISPNPKNHCTLGCVMASMINRSSGLKGNPAYDLMM